MKRETLMEATSVQIIGFDNVKVEVPLFNLRNSTRTRKQHSMVSTFFNFQLFQHKRHNKTIGNMKWYL
jgi:hypothetical protein